jgi:peptidoglycan/LPS O-acetylase OafA/YrhL
VSPAGGPPPPHPPRPHLRALTGVRFFAAAHVVVYHCVAWPSAGSLLARNLAGTGYVAVGLFFVLSGFILAYTYFGGRAAAPPLREFYVGRFARIYPVYALGLLLAAPFFAARYVRAHQYAELAITASLVAALLQAWTPRYALAWNAPAWSLSAEAFFYACFPFLAPPLMRSPPRVAALVAVAAWLATLAAAALYLAYRPDGIAAPDHTTDAFALDLLKYAPAFRLLDFVVGIALGRLYLDADVRARLARVAPALSVAAAIALLLVLAVSDRVPYVLLHSGLLTPIFAALILGLAFDEGPLARVLRGRAVVMLGEASYALYILHVPVFILAKKAAAPFAAPGVEETPAFAAAFFVAVVAISVACFRWIEVPARARLRALSLRH